MKKKLYEYKLVSLDKDEDFIASKTYYFQKETAKHHNQQYVLYEVPRKLIKVRGGEAIEVPSWWSGDITKFKKITNRENKSGK